MMPHMLGFQAFYSTLLQCPSSHQYLPGSCLFVADTPKPEYPPVCDQIEQSLVSFNAICCFITCSWQKMAIACVYWLPSISMSVGLENLGQLLLISHHVALIGDLNIEYLGCCY